MKQSYASIVALVFSVGVVHLTSSFSVQESLSNAFSEDASSWSDLGLGGDDLNLQVIESSLMSMVKEGTSPTLKPGIMAIYNLTNDMIASITSHSAIQQAKLNASWDKLVQCTAEDNQGTERFDYLRTILTECQLNHTSYWKCVESCKQVCESEASALAATRASQCPTTPYNCQMQVVALDDNRAVKDKILSLRQHFDSLRRVDCSNITKNCSNECTYNCSAVIVTADNCTTDVCEFEQTGCQLQHDACRVYTDCYDTRAAEYNVTLAEVTSDDEGTQNEYRAIFRIQCLLNAFLVSIDNPNGTGLDEGINYCIQRSYYQYFCKCNSCPLTALQDAVWNPFLGSPATYPADRAKCSSKYVRGAVATGCDNCAQPYIPIFITYPDVSTAPRKNCTTASFPRLQPEFDLVPGSTQWAAKYYSHWSQENRVTRCSLSADVCNVNASWNGVLPPNVTAHRRDLDSSNPYVR
eukprot:TRINITY_DN611_c0_g1_i2.p1 TRINITY_DN611_c0_g1~~TRINITY_DN611_c0_g1_i2.p1  ORF type:complete len:495 (+),score=52.08 TRINITY_DN611_c0_g1_i2:86-1486(+)